MKTATIKFLPVCSNCHQIIWGRIERIQRVAVINPKTGLYEYTISPDICDSCGAVFDSIEIPTSIPFDNF